MVINVESICNKNSDKIYFYVLYFVIYMNKNKKEFGSFEYILII